MHGPSEEAKENQTGTEFKSMRKVTTIRAKLNEEQGGGSRLTDVPITKHVLITPDNTKRKYES